MGYLPNYDRGYIKIVDVVGDVGQSTKIIHVDYAGKETDITRSVKSYNVTHAWGHLARVELDVVGQLDVHIPIETSRQRVGGR